MRWIDQVRESAIERFDVTKDVLGSAAVQPSACHPTEISGSRRHSHQSISSSEVRSFRRINSLKEPGMPRGMSPEHGPRVYVEIHVRKAWTMERWGVHARNSSSKCPGCSTGFAWQPNVLCYYIWVPSTVADLPLTRAHGQCQGQEGAHMFERSEYDACPRSSHPR